jgi:uncharacterized membrane protein
MSLVRLATDQELPPQTPFNKLAMIFFVAAKVFGLLGVALGFSLSLRVLGGILLVLAGICLVVCIFFCGKEMRRQNQEDKNNYNSLRHMAHEGTLASELEAMGYKLIKK